MSRTRIFISTGEPSGDLHAANLARELQARRPDVELIGFGGPRLQNAGVRLLYPLVELAVMWFGRAMLNLHKFLNLASRADRLFHHDRPDAVVLIDYPGFHFWLAWRARVRKIPVIWFVPPQLWAWAGWRVKKVKRDVSHLLCSLPFEPDWYRQRGMPAERCEFVGHPYFDELAERTLDESFVDAERSKPGTRILLLPGSRTQEVQKNLPTMLDAAVAMASSSKDRAEPDRFLIACLHERHRRMVAEIIASKAEWRGLPLELHAGRTPELIRLAQIAWSVSGSVGLELLNESVPTVVLYKIRPLDLLIARQFIKVPYISLVNLLADDEVMPEYLTAEDVSSQLAQWAQTWRDDPDRYAAARRRLIELRERVAFSGASAIAAQRILEIVGKARSEAEPNPDRDHGSVVARRPGLRLDRPNVDLQRVEEPTESSRTIRRGG